MIDQISQLQSLQLLAQGDAPSQFAVLGAQLLAVVVFSFLGMIVFIGGLFLIEKLTPFSIHHEIIEEHNTSLGIVLGAIVVGMSLIIAASILG